MLVLIDPPGRYCPTSTWQDFLERMQALPQNEPVRHAIKTAQREPSTARQGWHPAGGSFFQELPVIASIDTVERRNVHRLRPLRLTLKLRLDKFVLKLQKAVVPEP